MPWWIDAIFWSVEIVANIVTLILLQKASGWRESMTSLKTELQQSNKLLIQQEISQIKENIALAKQRLDDGDNAFEKANDKDAEINLKMTKEIYGLREWLLEKFATKADLQRHEQSMADRMKSLDEEQRKMAVNIASMGGN